MSKLDYLTEREIEGIIEYCHSKFKHYDSIDRMDIGKALTEVCIFNDMARKKSYYILDNEELSDFVMDYFTMDKL